jgi:hypothetical protein
MGLIAQKACEMRAKKWKQDFTRKAYPHEAASLQRRPAKDQTNRIFT